MVVYIVMSDKMETCHVQEPAKKYGNHLRCIFSVYKFAWYFPNTDHHSSQSYKIYIVDFEAKQKQYQRFDSTYN